MKRWATDSRLATDANCEREVLGLEGRTVCGGGWSDMLEVDEDGALRGQHVPDSLCFSEFVRAAKFSV